MHTPFVTHSILLYLLGCEQLVRYNESMEIAIACFLVIVCVVLIGLSALKIPKSAFSDYELRRRQALGDPQATFGLKRQAALPRLLALQYLLIMMLFGFATGIGFYMFGWGWGGLFVLGLVLFIAFMSRLSFARRISQRLYRRYETRIISGTKRYHSLIRHFAPSHDEPIGFTLASREELRHILKEAGEILSKEEIDLLLHALNFYDRSAGAVMTPIEDVRTIGASELLGPLVLDDLHKTGHKQFPVMATDGAVVGLLDISSSTGLRDKTSPLVRDVMHREVVRVPDDESLDEVLQLMTTSKQTTLLVVDEESPVGLVTLADVVQALTGQARR